VPSLPEASPPEIAIASWDCAENENIMEHVKTNIVFINEM
jgi:hypothetical protein